MFRRQLAALTAKAHMADTTISNQCSSYDASCGGCRITGAACPFSRDFRQCPDSSFVAHVAMAPDEFQVLVNGEGRPTLGTLRVIRCRTPEVHHNVAGVCTGALLKSAGNEAFLEVTWGEDRVDYRCRHEDVAFRWKDGRFMPL